MTKIQFSISEGSFSALRVVKRSDWFDNSFIGSSSAEGQLRFPKVDNGRYKSKHPIQDSNGNEVGSLIDGQIHVGYTFACLFFNGCFWVVHQRISDVINHRNHCSISLIEPKDKFMLFGKGYKFLIDKSFNLPSKWVSYLRAFKLIKSDRHGNKLLYITDVGFCVFDTSQKRLLAQVDFKELACRFSDFALSPKMPLLAVVFGTRDSIDPLDGEGSFNNFVRIFDLGSGDVIGSQTLPSKGNTYWLVDFDESGCKLEVKSEDGRERFLYELNSK